MTFQLENSPKNRNLDLFSFPSKHKKKVKKNIGVVKSEINAD